MRVLQAAEWIGKSIAIDHRPCLLLTGATGAGEGAVHKRAFTGATVPVPTTGIVGIGVKKGGTPGGPTPGNGLVILRPGCRDKRNYIEAQLCDGAIALPGGPGTLSEVGFCVALGKPVVLVEGAWESPVDPEHIDAAQITGEILREAVRKRTPSAESQSPLDPLIEYALDHVDEPRAEDIVPLPTTEADAGRIVERLLERLVGRPDPAAVLPGWVQRAYDRSTT